MTQISHCNNGVEYALKFDLKQVILTCYLKLVYVFHGVLLQITSKCTVSHGHVKVVCWPSVLIDLLHELDIIKLVLIYCLHFTNLHFTLLCMKNV